MKVSAMCIARNSDCHLLLDCAFGFVAKRDEFLGMRLEQGKPGVFDTKDTDLLLTRELAEKMYRQLGRVLKARGKAGDTAREDARPAEA